MGGKSIPGGETSTHKFTVAREIYLDEADLGMLSEMEEQKVQEIERKNRWWQDGIGASIQLRRYIQKKGTAFWSGRKNRCKYI